jgi:hypothetical protein
MRVSMVFVSRSLLLAAVLCAGAATATVPTKVSVSGKVTAISSESIQIDGVAYPLESNSLTRATLSNLRVGDKVSVEITLQRPAAVSQESHPISAGHEVVHWAPSTPGSTLRVVRAPERE